MKDFISQSFEGKCQAHFLKYDPEFAQRIMVRDWVFKIKQETIVEVDAFL